MSLNKVMVIGNLGADPEVRQTPGGQSVATLRMATTERWTDKSGQKQEKTEWHRVIVWGQQAEHCGKFLSKGRQVFVEGKLQTREWEKDGQKRYSTEIVAQRVQFLGGKSEGGHGGQGSGGGGNYGGSRGSEDFGAPQESTGNEGFSGDDDIPF